MIRFLASGTTGKLHEGSINFSHGPLVPGHVVRHVARYLSKDDGASIGIWVPVSTVPVTPASLVNMYAHWPNRAKHSLAPNGPRNGFIRIIQCNSVNIHVCVPISCADAGENLV